MPEANKKISLYRLHHSSCKDHISCWSLYSLHANRSIPIHSLFEMATPFPFAIPASPYGVGESLERPKPSNRYCKTPIQDRLTKKGTELLCSRKKVYDDTKPQQSKTIEDLVADELCGQHTLIKERYLVCRHSARSQASTDGLSI